jgi:hypothetical protein
MSTFGFLHVLLYLCVYASHTTYQVGFFLSVPEFAASQGLSSDFCNINEFPKIVNTRQWHFAGTDR